MGGRERDGWMVALLVRRELDGGTAGWGRAGRLMVALLIGRERAGRLDGGATGWERAGRLDGGAAGWESARRLDGGAAFWEGESGTAGWW